MLSQEKENQKLKGIRQTSDDILKPMNCRHCKFFIQHYGKEKGIYFKIYAGHCTCGVPLGKRKGKSNLTPEDTCLCFEEGQYGEW